MIRLSAVAIALDEVGAGIPVVLLHGFPIHPAPLGAGSADARGRRISSADAGSPGLRFI